jgi:pimeloyl-ACP methyl ester carboxylesterase
MIDSSLPAVSGRMHDVEIGTPDQNGIAPAVTAITHADAPFREQRYSAQDGLSLYYRAYGDPLASNTPVLCLPGLVRNSRDFHRTASRLCAGRYVLCPDYRGRGRSAYDPDPMNYVARVHVTDILHLFAAEGIHRVVVIGTSFGGLLGTALGVAAPTMLAGLVMNDVGPVIQDDGKGRIYDRIRRDDPQPDWESATQAFKRNNPGLRFPDERVWRDAVEGTWRKDADGVLRHDWDMHIADPVMKHAPMPDLWAFFRALRNIPVLAVRAANSDVLSPETFDRMAREHPGLERVVVPDTVHAPSLLEPECAAAIDRFVAVLDG